MEKENNNVIAGEVSVVTAKCINNQQWTKYHGKQGHGFAAEDANAMWDSYHGKSVDKVGMDNTLNGPDRIVDGVQIQTKYCADASKTISAAFDNGSYRYSGMKLEVPSDQYDEAVRLMRGRISNGDVPGVTDPNMAKQVVVKGHYSYEEAIQIAKAGNLDSIKFDAQTQSVACTYACGLSFAVAYWSAKTGGMTHKDALKEAAKQAVKSGGTTMVTGVAAQQLLRTTVGQSIAAATKTAMKPVVQNVMKTEVGKQAVARAATHIAGKQVAGAAAASVATKALRTNAVVSGVVFIGTAIPDVVSLCKGKISGREFTEKTATNAAGVGGGWAGAAIGTAICPGIGTLVGGVIGGFGASKGVQKVISCFKKN